MGLKAETIVPQGSTVTLQMYPKAEADKVIAELKEKHKTEVKELLCLIRDKDNNFNRAFESEEKEIRKLQRALWLARAERAEARKNYWYARSCLEGDKDLWFIDGSDVKYIGCIKRTNFDWLVTWSDVECKCRAYADKFKVAK